VKTIIIRLVLIIRPVHRPIAKKKRKNHKFLKNTLVSLKLQISKHVYGIFYIQVKAIKPMNFGKVSPVVLVQKALNGGKLKMEKKLYFSNP